MCDSLSFAGAFRPGTNSTDRTIVDELWACVSVIVVVIADI